ncbi:MAG: hypothetical protein R3F11_28850 [Verrucomicrobiales bacterium]
MIRGALLASEADAVRRFQLEAEAARGSTTRTSCRSTRSANFRGSITRHEADPGGTLADAMPAGRDPGVRAAEVRRSPAPSMPPTSAASSTATSSRATF